VKNEIQANLIEAALTAWDTVCQYVANHSSEFRGRKKETDVFRRLRTVIEGSSAGRTLRIQGPDDQVRFGNWSIDLVCSNGNKRIAIEGKYKLRGDGAVPDNRKAAFFDLYKLEQYVSTGGYSEGVFLWLTNKPGYILQATGDSANFSTHDGRIYQPGTPLDAFRCRDSSMPLPLVLRGFYVFNWRLVLAEGEWRCLAICVTRPDEQITLRDGA
jgi:hypothetical protein